MAALECGAYCGGIRGWYAERRVAECGVSLLSLLWVDVGSCSVGPQFGAYCGGLKVQGHPKSLEPTVED